MASWQLLRASEATLDRTAGHLQRGGGGRRPRGGHRVSHLCGPSAEAAGQGDRRSFASSPAEGERGEPVMRELNGKLSRFMEQVQSFEAANEKLEKLIEDYLDRKRRGDLTALEGECPRMGTGLQFVTTLRAQISATQRAASQTKLQLDQLELEALDLSVKLDEGRRQRESLEADLRDLRLIKQELEHRLPQLLHLLDSHTQELKQLKVQHRQEVQGLTQVPGGISIEMQCAESSKLMQQLEDLRDRSTAMVDKRQSQNAYWYSAQMSKLKSKEEVLPSSGSEVDKVEVDKLRMTTLKLKAELAKLQAQNVLLGNSLVDLRESYNMQIARFQHRADRLGEQLESVQQVAGQHSAEYQALLELKTRLEAEIEDYTQLLDKKSDSTSSASSPSVDALIDKTNSATFQSKATLDHIDAVSVEIVKDGVTAENDERASNCTITTSDLSGPVRQTAILNTAVSVTRKVAAERSEQVKIARYVQSKHPQDSSLASLDTLGQTDSSVVSSEGQIECVAGRNTVEEKVFESTERAAKERPSLTESLQMEDKNRPVDVHVQSKESLTHNTVIVQTGITGATGEKFGIQASKQDFNTVIESHGSLPDTQSTLRLWGVQVTTSEANTVKDIPNINNKGTEVTKVTSVNASEPAKKILAENTVTTLDQQITVTNRVQEAQPEINNQKKGMQTTNEQRNLFQAPREEDKHRLHEERVISPQLRSTEHHIQTSDGSETDPANSEIISARVEDPKHTKPAEEKESSVQRAFLVDIDTAGQNQRNVLEESQKREPAESRTGGTSERDIHADTDIGASGQSLGGVKLSHIQVNEVDRLPLSMLEKYAKYDGASSNEESVKEEALAPICNMEPRILTAYNSPEEQNEQLLGDSNTVSRVAFAERSELPADIISSIQNTDDALRNAQAVADPPSHVKSADQSLSAGCEIVRAETPVDGAKGVEDEEVEGQEGKGGEEGDEPVTEHVGGAPLNTRLERSRPAFQTCRVYHSSHVRENTNARPGCFTNTEHLLNTESQGTDGLILKDGEKKVASNHIAGETEEEIGRKNRDVIESRGQRAEEGEVGGKGDKGGNSTSHGTPVLNPIPAEEGSLQIEPGVICIRKNLSQTCLTSIDAEVIPNPNDFETSLSPVDTDGFQGPNDLESCLSPVDTEVFQEPNYLETCLSQFDAEVIPNPNDLETCLSPVDNEGFQGPNDLESCLSPVDAEVIPNPNDLETFLSPVDTEVFLGPKGPEECLSPAVKDVCMSPTEEFKRPVQRYILSSRLGQTEIDNMTKIPSPVKDRESVNLGSPTKTVSTFVGEMKKGHSFEDLCTRSSGNSEESINPGGRSRKTSIEQSELVSSPLSPGGRHRKLSLGDRDGTRISSIGSGVWNLSSTSSSGGAVANSPTFSVAVKRGGSFSVAATNAAGTAGCMDNNTGVRCGSLATNALADTGSKGSSVVTTFGGTAAHTTTTLGGINSRANFNNTFSTGGRQSTIKMPQSEERIVYGAGSGHMSSPANVSLTGAENGGRVMTPAVGHRATSRAERPNSGGSGEWKVYGGSMARVSRACCDSRLSTSTGSGSRLSGAVSGNRISSAGPSSTGPSSTGSGGRLCTSGGSGGRLGSSGSDGRISSAADCHRMSISGRYGSLGSGEWKAVYGGASGRISDTGSSGRQSGVTGGKRTPGPGVGRRPSSTGGSGGRLSGGSGGRISFSTRNTVSSAGSSGNLSRSGSSERLVPRTSSSSGSGRTNSMGGRVISSSDGPIRSTGSGAGANKQRISVCKMAALTISAAGRGRSQEPGRPGGRSKQQLAADSVQRWVTTGVGGRGDDPDLLDDITGL